MKVVRENRVAFRGRSMCDIVADAYFAIDDYTRPYFELAGANADGA